MDWLEHLAVIFRYSTRWSYLWSLLVWDNQNNSLEILWNCLTGRKSEEFAFLDHKSYFALKSKFYLKKNAIDNKIVNEKLEGLEENAIVKITADNLPENFPVSFIFDLCRFSGTPIQ